MKRLIALLLVLASSVAPAAILVGTDGSTTNTSSQTSDPDYYYHRQGGFVASASGTATSLCIYLTQVNTTTTIRLALYDSAGDKIGEGTVAAATGAICASISSVAITESQTYYIAYEGDGYYRVADTSDTWAMSRVSHTFGTMPSTITVPGGSSVNMGIPSTWVDGTVGGGSPTLSSPTPSGTLGTETTATVGATSTASTGTFYAILSTSNNASGASCAQIKAGQNSTGASASFAEDDTVSTTSPSVGFTGLTGSTLYYYAACHTDSNGDSNVVSGSFTTAAADIVATKLVFGSQPGNVIVGQTFGAFTVRAVDDSDALDEDFEDDVTVALETGNGELAGTLTETAVAGIATFDDVHTDTLNVDAVIQATADGLTAANSDEFDVTAGGEGGTAGFPSSSRLGGLLQ